MLIVLNGASSAGKTLTAQALAAQLGPDCILTGFDDILARVQPFGPETGNPWRSLKTIFFQLTNGRLKLFKRLHREIIEHVRAGRSVIVETSLLGPQALGDAAECFAPLEGFFIALKPPLAVSEQWEAQRGDRPVGQARKHYDLIHAHGQYDLVLDPSTLTPEACAQAILNRVNGPPPEAFRRLSVG